jgi:hypothetical protein
MSNTDQYRDELQDSLNRFLRGWENGDKGVILSALESNCTLASSAHGTILSSEVISQRLATDFPQSYKLGLYSTNHYMALLKDRDKEAVMSSYVYGKAADFIFGATMVAELVEREEGKWNFVRIKLSVNWTDGNTSKLDKYKLPRNNRTYQIGDPTPVIISELDAPWNRYPDSVFLGNKQ